MFQKFMKWWTADHIQALKKGAVMAAGIAVYVLPAGPWRELAAGIAAGGLTDSTFGSVWKALQGSAGVKS